MESGFSKANSNNLPRVDAVMLGPHELHMGTTLLAMCSLSVTVNATVKCKICPEHKVHAKLYGCTLVVDEENEVVLSVQCEDCVASQGGCKHAIAFHVASSPQ
ncbi:hypothetical protein EVAR_76829_1 [Eumeta japonica]|uniref:Uncharacterized protein n=1 Tax=Eumeta variegata TaxID=151549 RepID=A0A4C1Z523_EUMVA|nr:hypothetical protein EVAR_76829_1 [Eumeta japonica]